MDPLDTSMDPLDTNTDLPDMVLPGSRDLMSTSATANIKGQNIVNTTTDPVMIRDQRASMKRLWICMTRPNGQAIEDLKALEGQADQEVPVALVVEDHLWKVMQVF
jgi:hypothetical protein